MESADVVVIGAGIVGLSAARRLASAGRRVVVVERGRVGEEASAAAAGMLAAQAEASEPSPLLSLALLGRARHRSLARELREETGIDVDLSPEGILDLAFTEGDEARLLRRAEWQAAAGLSAAVLSAEEVRQAEPNLSPVRRGVFFPEDRRVDNVRLVRALAASAVARGASLVCGRPASALVVESGRVAGVRAATDLVTAPVVINAAGAWAALLAGDPAPPPVEPIRGHIVAFDLSPPLLRHVVCSPRGYLVPHASGRVLAGSTTERAGFDKSVTAGALRAVLDLALEIVPALAQVRVAEMWAGLRPGTPDGLPILGPGALPGLIHATGLFRNGILLGPVVGELAAELALGLRLDVDIRPFSPARFPRP